MKCKSCNENIELRMRKALSANECPYCGKVILEKESMQQFLDLHSVLDPQCFIDNPDFDKQIKEKTIRILMEYMKCVKIKSIKQEDDIVKLGNEKPRTISSIQANDPALVNESQKMRKDMYVEAFKEQYGDEPPIKETVVEQSESEITEEDLEASKGVVFSNAGDPNTVDRVEQLKRVVKNPSGKNKPITRIQ